MADSNGERVGLLMVGLGGNNGTTVTAALRAKALDITWHTKRGAQKANFYGSLTQASCVRRFDDANPGVTLHVPMSEAAPFVDPVDLVVGGWDISGKTIGEGMTRAEVLDYDLQRQLLEVDAETFAQVPMPGLYYPSFVASNQADRADNVLHGNTKKDDLARIRNDIKTFKEANGCSRVVVVWTASTECLVPEEAGINDTAANLMSMLEQESADGDLQTVSPSQVFALAAILEGCPYLNGSPQNTFVPGVVEVAKSEGVYIGGKDFKSGQTKMKAVLADFLMSAGMKLESVASYNHLGNNDGKNLNEAEQFRSKEVSKSGLVGDMCATNPVLYPVREDGTRDEPDHVVVIKYVPHVGDSKRALDEYVSSIFMGGESTISIHNTCEDSLLASPLIIDIVIITELAQRLSVHGGWEAVAPRYVDNDVVLAPLLDYFFKAPERAHQDTYVDQSLFRQRQVVEDFCADADAILKGGN